MGVCESNATASLIGPLVQGIEKVLEGTSSPGAGTMEEQIISQIRSRFSPTMRNKQVLLATLLDPRFKDIAFPDGSSKCRAKEFLLQELQHLHEESGTKSRTTSTKTSPLTETGPKTTSIWQALNQALSQSQPLTEDPKSAKWNSEIDQYLSTSTLPIDDNPFLYWKRLWAEDIIAVICETRRSQGPQQVSAAFLLYWEIFQSCKGEGIRMISQLMSHKSLPMLCLGCDIAIRNQSGSDNFPAATQLEWVQIGQRVTWFSQWRHWFTLLDLEETELAQHGGPPEGCLPSTHSLLGFSVQWWCVCCFHEAELVSQHPCHVVDWSLILFRRVQIIMEIRSI
ncbi:unnamed protein product [Darwinula stevensoni]|uniref:Uncharacterized protein n=1 Tax=Darwinula stevensoni TaxID=69355 RepID=A0A7R9FMW4_9CRUS|nr:unnamed protein product [Darwinula stevensoni]CAG0896152.1 unnamed protein product [Darwinula stevensoni]